MNIQKMSCCMVFYYENCSTDHDTFHFVNFLKNKNAIFALTGLKPATFVPVPSQVLDFQCHMS